MDKENVGIVIVVIIVAMLIVGLILGLMWGLPQYRVWQQGMSGKAKLAEAEFSRQTKVCEARALAESAELWGKAEITKAKAMAEANNILGSSLKGNHEYLVYLWIESLKETQDKVIYVPTEAGLPVLESTRFLNK